MKANRVNDKGWFNKTLDYKVVLTPVFPPNAQHIKRRYIMYC